MRKTVRFEVRDVSSAPDILKKMFDVEETPSGVCTVEGPSRVWYKPWTWFRPSRTILRFEAVSCDVVPNKNGLLYQMSGIHVQ